MEWFVLQAGIRTTFQPGFSTNEQADQCGGCFLVFVSCRGEDQRKIAGNFSFQWEESKEWEGGPQKVASLTSDIQTFTTAPNPKSPLRTRMKSEYMSRFDTVSKQEGEIANALPSTRTLPQHWHPVAAVQPRGSRAKAALQIRLALSLITSEISALVPSDTQARGCAAHSARAAIWKGFAVWDRKWLPCPSPSSVSGSAQTSVSWTRLLGKWER